MLPDPVGDDPSTLSTDSASAPQLDGVTAPNVVDRYRMLVEHTPDAICVHQRGVIVYLNPSGLRYLEADDQEQVLGHMITEFVHPDSIAPMLARIAELGDAGNASEPSEATVVTLRGRHIPAEAVSVRTSWNGEPALQVILRDLTEQKAAQQALQYQAALVTHVSDAIVGVASDGLVSSWNPAAESMYGWTGRQVIGKGLAHAFGVLCDPNAVLAEGGKLRDTHRRADGTALPVLVSVAQMNEGWVLVCAEQTALRRAEAHFTAVVESLDEGIVVLDHAGRITTANLAAKTILDIGVGVETAGKADELPFRVHDTDDNPVDKHHHPLARTKSTGQPSTGILGVQRRRDGRRFWLSVTATVLDAGDRASPIVASFVDVTESHKASVKLEHAATHDHLTGLPNRLLLLARLDQELAQPSRRRSVTVLFIDLDDFKAINDANGHAVGDAVLEVMASRLVGSVDPNAVVGRIGGDEFVAVVPGGVGVDTDDIGAQLSAPMTVDGVTLTVAASIGCVVVAPGDGRSALDVLNAADLEMYQAKPAQPRWL